MVAWRIEHSQPEDPVRQICLVVQDTGQGIPEDQQRHLFDAFYRDERPGRDKPTGWGLGLAIVVSNHSRIETIQIAEQNR